MSPNHTRLAAIVLACVVVLTLVISSRDASTLRHQREERAKREAIGRAWDKRW